MWLERAMMGCGKAWEICRQHYRCDTDVAWRFTTPQKGSQELPQTGPAARSRFAPHGEKR
jgi:hypothetical protein